MATSARKVGVTDNPAGAGIQEYQAFQGPLPGLLEAAGLMPVGDQVQLSIEGTSFTPTLISGTGGAGPPFPIGAYRVPSNKVFLFTGGLYFNLAAATDFVRIVRRYFLYGYQASAAPAAPAAPTIALLASNFAGIGTAGVFSYKVAAFDMFFREAAATVASGTVTLTGTNRAISVTLPALPAGAAGYNIYRTLAGGSTYYFVGRTISTGAAYVDIMPDANVDVSLVPSATWVVGEILGETMDGAGSLVFEVGSTAINAAPSRFAFVDSRGLVVTTNAAFPATGGLTVGARSYVPMPTGGKGTGAGSIVGQNIWRGPFVGNDFFEMVNTDLGIAGVNGMVGVAPTAGSFTVWGHQTIGVSERMEATAAIKTSRIVPLHPNGILLPARAELTIEVISLAAGVAGARQVQVNGVLLPLTAT